MALPRIRSAVVGAVLLCLAGVGVGSAPASAAPASYPTPDGWVVDAAGVLSPDGEAGLENTLAAYEKRTGNEVAVVTVTTLGGQTIESYATGLFNAWGIGKAGKNNGVLLLLAMADHRSRLEVGTGLEGILGVERTDTILDDVVKPAMRRGDVLGAVTQAVAAVTETLDGSGAGATSPAYRAPAYSAPAYSAPANSAPAYPAPLYSAPAETPQRHSNEPPWPLIFVVILVIVVVTNVLWGGNSNSSNGYNSRRSSSFSGGSSHFSSSGGGSSHSSGGGGSSSGGGSSGSW